MASSGVPPSSLAERLSLSLLLSAALHLGRPAHLLHFFRAIAHKMSIIVIESGTTSKGINLVIGQLVFPYAVLMLAA